MWPPGSFLNPLGFTLLFNELERWEERYTVWKSADETKLLCLLWTERAVRNAWERELSDINALCSGE